MKLIARKDFRNNCKIKIANAHNEHHVHKGATFEIDETDDKGLETIALLNNAGCVALADSKEADVIRAEVAAEEKKAKADAPKK